MNEDLAPINTTTGVNLTKDPVKRITKRVLKRTDRKLLKNVMGIKEFKDFEVRNDS